MRVASTAVQTQLVRLTSRAHLASGFNRAHVRAAVVSGHSNAPACVTICRRQSNAGASTMRGVKKENLPTKVCVTCNRPFTWRKKWESCWDEVSTCSKSCNAKRRASKQVTNASAKTNANASDDGDEDGSASGSEGESDERTKHKAAVKAQKAGRRARLEFKGDPTSGQKNCDECDVLVNELIRCQTDSTKRWRMVCGKCWVKVSGGVVDGDVNHPNYRYGGLWKNRRVQHVADETNIAAHSVVQ